MGDNIQTQIEELQAQIRRCQPQRGAGSKERASVAAVRGTMKLKLDDLRRQLKAESKPDLSAVMATKVGDTLWCDHDHGRRTWCSGTITSETKGLWIVGGVHRVNKKTMMESMGKYTPHTWFTEAQKSDYLWRNDHRWKISTIVSTADADTLRQIAGIIGYKPEE